jgi:hypothetical protein
VCSLEFGVSDRLLDFVLLTVSLWGNADEHRWFVAILTNALVYSCCLSVSILSPSGLGCTWATCISRLKEPLDQAASSLADTTTPEAGRDPLSFPTLQLPSLGATVFPIET